MLAGGPGPAAAARQAAALFGLSGVLALAAIPSEQADVWVLLGIAATDLAVAIVAVFAPWPRWGPLSTIWLAIAALAILGVSTWAFGGFAAGTGPFFILLFTWLGLHHKERVIVWLSLPAGAAYAGGLIAAHAAARLVTSTIVLVPIATAVGLVIARRVRALEKARDEVQFANHFRIDLLGMLGHELGNPLTAIQWSSESGATAHFRGDEERIREAFEAIDRNAAEIRRVLREVLTLVMSDRGVLTARPERCVLGPVLREAASSQPAGHEPVVECPPDLAAFVQPGHLDQMLVNLLSNAEKYAGGATRLSARRTDAGEVELAIVDAGPGLPLGFREHLFERFSRSSDTAGHVVGSGLGLFISRELARANGGDLTHQVGNPSGSVFVVTLPAAPGASDSDGAGRGA